MAFHKKKPPLSGAASRVKGQHKPGRRVYLCLLKRSPTHSVITTVFGVLELE